MDLEEKPKDGDAAVNVVAKILNTSKGQWVRRRQDSNIRQKNGGEGLAFPRMP